MDPLEAAFEFVEWLGEVDALGAVVVGHERASPMCCPIDRTGRSPIKRERDMRFTLSTTTVGGTLATMAVAVTIAVPAAYGGPATDPAQTAGATDVTNPAAVPPPPSLMAASAAKAYDRLRSQAAQHSTPVANVPPPPSLMAASAAKAYDRLRSQAAQHSTPVADDRPAPGGFDWLSAIIGAAAIAGLVLVSLAALGLRRVHGHRAASA